MCGGLISASPLLDAIGRGVVLATEFAWQELRRTLEFLGKS